MQTWLTEASLEKIPAKYLSIYSVHVYATYLVPPKAVFYPILILPPKADFEVGYFGISREEVFQSFIKFWIRVWIYMCPTDFTVEVFELWDFRLKSLHRIPYNTCEIKVWCAKIQMRFYKLWDTPWLNLILKSSRLKNSYILFS